MLFGKKETVPVSSTDRYAVRICPICLKTTVFGNYCCECGKKITENTAMMVFSKVRCVKCSEYVPDKTFCTSCGNKL